MMAAVAEDTTAPAARETVTSHGVLVQECTVSNNQHTKQTQQPSFCEQSNTTTVETTTTSHCYTDVEDSFNQNNDSNVNDDSDSDNGSDNDNDNGNSSYWDVLMTLYLPLILLWFRRSMFGPANLIRTIIVGQLMRLVFVDNITEWISEKLPPWLQVLLFRSSAAATGTGNGMSTVLGVAVANGKIDPHAWPPPAFTALALLTIFALVVHPDGLTWIMLGKLRDAIYAVFSALAQCLEFLVNDYGVFPTIIAAITLATMVFLVFVVLRTLSPKNRLRDSNSNNNNNNMHNSDKKKKKKKGGNARHRREHHHNQHHHRSNRIKHTQLHSGLVENDPTEGTPSSPISSPPPSEFHNDTSSPSSSPTPSLNNTAKDSPIHVPSSSLSASAATNVDGNENIKQTTNNMSMSNGANNKSATSVNANDSRTRRRMMSSSTLDTTPLCDDQSCGSTSVRSYPSVSVNSNRSGNTKTSSIGSGSTPSRRGKRPGALKSPKNMNMDRNSTGQKNKSATIVASPVESSVSSRWDALKPENSGSNSSNTHSHHHANGNTNNKKYHQYQQQQQQQQQQRHHRGIIRRGQGVNGNGPNRKGRHNQNSVNELPMINRNPAVTIPGSSSLSSLNNVRSKINEVSPIASTRQHNNGFVTSSTISATTTNPVLNSYTTSPRTNNMPPPPPGFQNVSIMSGLEERKVDQHQHHENIDLSVPTLFDTPFVIRSASEQHQKNDWKTDPSVRAAIAVSSPQCAAVIAPDFFPSSSLVPSYGGASNGGTTIIQENPFSSNINATHNNTMSRHQENLDSQIEADLQELGGQMAGSILDF